MAVKVNGVVKAEMNSDDSRSWHADSRFFNQLYTNSTGGPIEVAISGTAASGLYIIVDDLNIVVGIPVNPMGYGLNASFTVPNGSIYGVVAQGDYVFLGWHELY